jgi:multiple sugar transport system substrate-binding protein
MTLLRRLSISGLALPVILAAGCGGGNQGQEGAAPPSAPGNAKTNEASASWADQPAELVVYGNPGDPENVFNARIGDAVRKKFPNYKITYLQRNADTTMDKLIASGSQVDLIYDSVGGASGSLIATNSQFDISELVKKHQIDLNRFDPGQLDAVKQFGGLYGLPVQTGGLVLYYNKDIFDKFGVPYPKNGMTWDEAIELGNRLTRMDNGVQYIGLGLSVGHALLMNSLSLPYIDKNTGKAAINNDSYKRLVETLVLRPTQAAGYKERIRAINRTFNNDDFMKDRHMAMFVMNYGLQDQKDFQEFNWDMAPLPTFPEKPGIGTQPYPNILFVTATSKYKDQAVEVLKFLTSDEYQLDMAKRGFIPILKDEKIRKAFAQDMGYKDKNVVNAVFYNKVAATAPKTKYDGIVSGALNKQLIGLIKGEVDLNTALRQAEEEANKGIEAAKSQE